MIVRSVPPDLRLAGIVRSYRSREANLAVDARVKLPARTDVLLEFYFTLPHRLEFQANKALDNAPWIAAVGPQTHRRVDLLLSGRLDIFTIDFTATGLHSLIGVSMPQLTDEGVDAGGLLGDRDMRILHDRLASAHGLEQRARIADGFLTGLLMKRRKPFGNPIIAGGLATIRQTRGQDSGHSYAAAAGMSERHFRRLFEQQVGMTPKLYARIVRLESAIRAKNKAPTRNWTDIAHECGWFDQSHMDKDFRLFTGTIPTQHGPPLA